MTPSPSLSPTLDPAIVFFKRHVYSAHGCSSTTEYVDAANSSVATDLCKYALTREGKRDIRTGRIIQWAMTRAFRRCLQNNDCGARKADGNCTCGWSYYFSTEPIDNLAALSTLIAQEATRIKTFRAKIATIDLTAHDTLASLEDFVDHNYGGITQLENPLNIPLPHERPVAIPPPDWRALAAPTGRAPTGADIVSRPSSRSSRPDQPMEPTRTNIHEPSTDRPPRTIDGLPNPRSDATGRHQWSDAAPGPSTVDGLCNPRIATRTGLRRAWSPRPSRPDHPPDATRTPGRRDLH